MQSTQLAAKKREESLQSANPVVETMASLLRSALAQTPGDASFQAVEQNALALCNEVTRLVLERQLQAIADSLPDEIMIGGRAYRRHETGWVKYHSLCGELNVRRATYRLLGVRNGPTVVPLDLRAGLISRGTPALAFSVAQGFAMGPLRDYEAEMAAAHRQPPSRSTLERLAKSVGKQVKDDVAVMEAVVRANEAVPEDAHAISMGLDRTTVPMAEERPRSKWEPSPKKRRRRPRVRRAPHPIEVNYRMAYVGTVSVTDRRGEVLVTRRYAATADEGPDEVVYRMMQDVRALRRERGLPLAIVQDGAPELWNLLRDALRAAGVKDWVEIIDIFHMREHVSQLLDLVPSRQSKQKWLRRLEKDNRTVSHLLGLIERKMRSSPPPFSPALFTQWSYLQGHSRRTRYASFKQRGFAIGSGVTEGACKSLVMMRTKRSGQRWRPDGVTAALTLRALLQSDRLNSVWGLFRQRFVHEVNALN